MASVELVGLHKSYGAVEVIKGIDLTIADGEFVVLVGPSGCGKSTLLRMIAGLESIGAGTIAIGGKVVNALELQTRVEIRELHERLKATSVFVTHDQVEAMTLADRIVLLEAGTIQQVGSPLDLYNRPANVFVAGFIGSPQMNLLPAEVIAGEGEPRAALTGLDGVVPLGAPAAPPGSTILIGCRPEHTELTAPDFAGAFIKGEVLAVERLGSETHVYVRAGDQRFCASTRDPIELRAHDRVGLRPQTERLHLFDAKTGIRIPA